MGWVGDLEGKSGLNKTHAMKLRGASEKARGVPAATSSGPALERGKVKEPKG